MKPIRCLRVLGVSTGTLRVRVETFTKSCNTAYVPTRPHLPPWGRQVATASRRQGSPPRTCTTQHLTSSHCWSRADPHPAVLAFCCQKTHPVGCGPSPRRSTERMHRYISVVEVVAVCCCFIFRISLSYQIFINLYYGLESRISMGF